MRTVRPLVAMLLALSLLAPPAPAQSDKAVEAGIYVAKFLGEYAAGKGLDALFAGGGPSTEDRVKELNLRLASYESALRQVDAKAADQVASMRKELSTKTTREDVRAIVKKTLGELDGRIAKLEAGADRLENRQDKVDARVKQIEDLFGHIPSVPPAPLLLSSVEAGEPKAHPLTLAWLKLLTRSEQSRQGLEELRRTRPDTSKAVLEALAKDKALVAETAKLHGMVKEDLARRLADRQDLLREYKHGSAKVRAFDEEMASVTWLMAVTRPIAQGAHAGRLGVPPALFGPQASEMILAFKLSKAEPAEVADLYRQHFLAQAASDPFLGVSLDRAKLTKEMTKIGDEAIEAALVGFTNAPVVQLVERNLQAALKDFSAESKEVRSERARQALCMTYIRKLNKTCADLLKRGSKLYVEAMERERPTNARMTAFREGVLLPLAAWGAMTRSQEEGHDPEAWGRISGYRWGEVNLIGHRAVVGTVAWSPDGKRIATSSDDKTAKVWDAETGKGLSSLRGHTASVLYVAWSPDGKRLATSSIDHSAKVWDAGTGKQICALVGHSKIVGRVAWSPDGKRLATVSWDKTAKVWDAGTGKELLSFKGHTDCVDTVAWSPDGKRIVTAGWDETVKVWDAGWGRELFALGGRTTRKGTGGIRHVAWSSDGKRLATASYGKKPMVKEWDAGTGKELLSFEGPADDVDTVAWLPGGKRLATANKKTARVWDAETGKEFFSLTGLADDMRIVAWSPDGERIAIANDKTAKVCLLAEAITRASRAK